jgi:hypothetical protein
MLVVVIVVVIVAYKLTINTAATKADTQDRYPKNDA